MILEPLTLPPDHGLPGELLTELTALYASHRDFHALGGDFPDPDDIRPEQVATALADELADPDVEVLLARGEGRLVGIAITLAHHPDPADPDPWIGLLMIDASVQGKGYGRRLASLVEDRFHAAGRSAVRLAVLENNPAGLAFGPPSATRSSTVARTFNWAARARCCASGWSEEPVRSGQGCAGLPSPCSQCSQISPKSLSGAFFST